MEYASTMQTYIPTGELVYTDSGSTESARLENRKLFKILFKLLYLRFPPLQIRTCVFRTCIFHPCTFVGYLRIPYLHIPSSGTFVFRTCVFSRPVVICLTVVGKLFHARGPATAELLSPRVVRVRGSGTASVL